MHASTVVVDPPRAAPTQTPGGADFLTKAAWLQELLPVQLPAMLLYALLLSSAAAGVSGSRGSQVAICSRAACCP